MRSTASQRRRSKQECRKAAERGEWGIAGKLSVDLRWDDDTPCHLTAFPEVSLLQSIATSVGTDRMSGGTVGIQVHQTSDLLILHNDASLLWTSRGNLAGWGAEVWASWVQCMVL